MGLTVRRCGKREKAGHKEEECGLDIPNQVMSLEDQQFENTPRATWVEARPKNSAETRSGVESKTRSRLHALSSHSGGTASTLQQTTKAESSAKVNIK